MPGKKHFVHAMKGFAAKAGHTLRWFNPRTGEWLPSQTVSAGEDGGFALPPRPDEQDWALELLPSEQIGK